jgi:hypothetical protein
MEKRGITCISICDQLPNAEFHDLCLELGDDGSWQLIDVRGGGPVIELAG